MGSGKRKAVLGTGSEKLSSESSWLKTFSLWLLVLNSGTGLFSSRSLLEQQWVLDPTVVHPQSAQIPRRQPGVRVLPKRDDDSLSVN